MRIGKIWFQHAQTKTFCILLTSHGYGIVGIQDWD